MRSRRTARGAWSRAGVQRVGLGSCFCFSQPATDLEGVGTGCLGNRRKKKRLVKGRKGELG